MVKGNPSKLQCPRHLQRRVTSARGSRCNPNPVQGTNHHVLGSLSAELQTTVGVYATCADIQQSIREALLIGRVRV